MLEFAKECPAPAKLWKLLEDQTITAEQGYSQDHIRFMLFIALRLARNFENAKLRLNDYLSGKTPLSVFAAIADKLGDYDIKITGSDIQALRPIADMTDVVVFEELYLVSIFMRQLLYGKAGVGKLLNDLLDPIGSNIISHIIEDISVFPTDITQYRLNTQTDFDYMSMFSIESSGPTQPTPVGSRLDIVNFMRTSISKHIAASDTMSISVGNSISIPEFIYTITEEDAVPTPYPTPDDEPLPWDEPTTPEYTVGMMLKCIQGIGDRVKGNVYEITSITKHGVYVSCDSDEPHNASIPEHMSAYFTIENTPVTQDLSWDDIRVGSRVRFTDKNEYSRDNGDIYEVTKIHKEQVYISSNNTASKGTRDYWKDLFTIEEI